MITNPDPQSELDALWGRSNLSAAQTLVWLTQKRHPDVPLHNTSPALWIIPAEIERPKFEQAFQAVIDGSDALRTVIEEKDGAPCQRVLPRITYPLEMLDFAAVGNSMPELQSWAKQRSQRLFDLRQPMFDSVLIRLPEGKSAWYLNHHRIVADGWSTLLIFRRAAEFYELLLNGREKVSADLPQYAEFIAHERQLRATPEYEAARMYWQQKFHDPPPSMAFAETGPATLATQRFRVSADLGAIRSRQLRNLAAGPAFADSFPNLALFALFAGVFLTALHQVSDHQRFALGTPVSNRLSRKFQQTLGSFTHMAVLFIEVTDSGTLVALARQAREEMVKVLCHQHYVPATLPPRRLYDAMINYCHSTAGTFLGAAVQTESVDSGYQDDSQEKLAMQVRDFDATGNFVLDFDFRRDVFNEEQGRQIADRVVAILDLFLEDERRSLSELVPAVAGQRPAASATSAMETSVTIDASPPAKQVHSSSQTSSEETLARLWAKALGLAQVGRDDNFFDMGGTSLQAARLFAGIEETFGVNLPLSTLVQAPTIAELHRLLGSGSDSLQWPSLVKIQEGTGGTPLFCTHGVGGDILGFRNLARHLDPRRPVFGLRARGLDGRQQPMDRIEDMAAAYIREIRCVQPDEPYALIGFSFGGLIAYEMARQLVAQGQKMLLVGLLDTRKLLSMQTFLLNVALAPARQKLRFIRAAFEGRTRGGAVTRSRLSTLPSPAGAPALRRDRIRAVREGCIKAAKHYVLPPFDGRLLFFQTRALLAPSVFSRLRYPWHELCQGGVEVRELPCDHWSILQEPHVQALAEMLEQGLALREENR